jgi:acyl-CoA reductase-like NAD-dependent aldehyde dehydrogenase
LRANDTEYGLSNYVSSQNVNTAVAVAKQLRSGNVHINAAPLDLTTSFGGYKKSGNVVNMAQQACMILWRANLYCALKM